ncbi:MAG: MFS transporter [Chloroflexota bacterium]|nr:MFS transporter [Chloroflexota bacterium]
MTQTTLTGDSKSIADGQRPPVRTDLGYATITLGSTAIWSVLSGWLLYFYLPPEGEGTALVPVALYGATMFVTRTVNAVIAPPIGVLSDQTRSRWGRRLPFMFVSTLPMLVFFVLLWTPPVQGNSIWNLIYLALIFALYNVAYSFNQIPYTALLPELALTDHHRVRISAWAASFFLVGMILGGLAGLLIENVGYTTMALIYAGVTLPLFYLPFLVLRERSDRQIAPAERLDFRQSIAAMLRNRAFLVMTATGVCYWSVTSFVQSAIPFIVTEICLLTKSDTLYFYIPGLLASLVCYPLVTWLSGRLGKWIVFSGSLLASAIVLPGLMLIGDWLPVPLNVQGIVWITLQAVAMSGVTMLPPAFGAEITDYDATLTGQRREGTYYAIWGLLDQVINGVAAAALPLLLLLGRSHSDPRGPLGVRMIGLVTGLLMFVAFLIFLNYPLRHRLSPKGVHDEYHDRANC